MSKVVRQMAEEEVKPDMTPMIDAVFLLLIFFMCMKFKQYEKKLDSELPKDQGLSASTPMPLQQLRIRIQLLPGSVDKVQIVPDPLNEHFRVIQWRDGGKNQMFAELTAQVRRGYPYIGDKIEVAPDERVPFDYVALTLNAIHDAQQSVAPDLQKRIMFAAAAPN